MYLVGYSLQLMLGLRSAVVPGRYGRSDLYSSSGVLSFNNYLSTNLNAPDYYLRALGSN